MIRARVARVSDSRSAVCPEAAFDGVNRNDFFQRVIGDVLSGANVPDGVFCIHCRSMRDESALVRITSQSQSPGALEWEPHMAIS